MPKDSFVKQQTIFDGIKAYYFTLLYVYSLTTFVINIVAEKEKKIRELMKMMGLKDFMFWLSWISTYFIQFTVLNLIISVLMYAIKFYTTFSMTLIFYVLIECYSIVSIIFGAFVSTFFQNSKTAGSACASIYSLMSFLYFIIFLPRVFNINLPVSLQWILSLLFPCAFSLAIDQALFIQANYGTFFSFDMFVNSVRPNSISLLSCLVMLILDGFLYFLLAIYFDNVIQGEFGRAKSYLFFLKSSFWKRKKNFLNETILDDVEILDENNEQIGDEFKNKIALNIRGLVKKFKNEKGEEYSAVDNMNLTVYSGQITAILGHNGAGK
ncbi:unnamed protein product [Brachionus calyciflorus]|uniref:ABC-2 type transporter transmembrane domain-containing protein n=2 Tax=Brachionus calyciflorus TaxID=104777 RepID=A0A814ITH8_9BILA|nr:unnamed protein product [Brachionus calyciflorus]